MSLEWYDRTASSYVPKQSSSWIVYFKVSVVGAADCDALALIGQSVLLGRELSKEQHIDSTEWIDDANDKITKVKIVNYFKQWKWILNARALKGACASHG